MRQPTAEILNAAKIVSLKLPRLLNISLAALVISLMITYLFQTNIVTTKGFELSTLLEQKNKLLEEKTSLDVELQRLQSLPEIGDKLKTLNLTPVSDVTYLEATKPAFAYDEGRQSK